MNDIDLCKELNEEYVDIYEEQYVWTDLYTSYIHIDSYTEMREEPDRNYTDYMVFSLKSRISNWVNNNWDDSIEISFINRTKSNSQNKLYLTVQLLVGGDVLELNNKMINELQIYVNSINLEDLKSVLLYGFAQINSRTNMLTTEKGYIIPQDWIREVIYYVDINAKLNPFINETGLYVEIGNYPDYSIIYDKLSVNLVKKLREMFEEGYIIEPPENIIEDWILTPLDDKNLLYIPIWTDNRITESYGTLTNFMITRLNGDKDINYYVGNNQVIRHYIAELLKDKEYKYVGYYLNIEISGLKEAQEIATYIEYANEIATGIIIQTHVTSIDDVNIYMKIIDDGDVLYYKTDDVYRPYTVSIRYSYDKNINSFATSSELLRKFIEYRDELYPVYPPVTEEKMIETYEPYISDEKIDNVEGIKNESKRDYAERVLLLDSSKPAELLSKEEKGDVLYEEYNKNNPDRIWKILDEDKRFNIKELDKVELNIDERPILTEGQINLLDDIRKKEILYAP